MPGTFDRDGAFSLELGEDKENAIQQMLTLNESLYVFSTKKIFRDVLLTTLIPTVRAPKRATRTKRSIP